MDTRTSIREPIRSLPPTHMSKHHAGAIGSNLPYGHYQAAQNVNRGHYENLYLAPGSRTGNDRVGDMSMLSDNYGRMNIQMPHYAGPNKPSPAISTQSFEGGVPLGGMPQTVIPNGQMIYQNHIVSSAVPHYNDSVAHNYGMFPQYMNPPPFQYHQSMMQSPSAISSGWAPSSRVPSIEVPSLVTPRRDSSSSREADFPGTPYTGQTGYGGYQAGAAVVDRSPHSAYTAWGTPSPSQQGYKLQQKASLSPRLQLLIQQDPPIPFAIPAPFSPVKPLDRSLENPHGITNVYVRGLQPETTDELLHKLAGRFGDIVSSKSIIDHGTGLCKGFGFVKFHNFRDAEDCIRGFHYLGYESSFARESFYSQLKKLQDESNTNLYVSNLPKTMNEHELGAIFEPHSVCSSRILRDSAGNGRGVGFARFESREICELIIKKFNNFAVKKGGEEHLIQIRYADTPDQKHLKQQTTAARQYRSAEYESVTSGRTPYTTPARFMPGNPGNAITATDFENYMTSATGCQRPFGDLNVRDRLSNVSSHLSTPHGSVVNVNVKLPNTPGTTSTYEAHDSANGVNDKNDENAVKLDNLETQSHESGESGNEGVVVASK